MAALLGTQAEAADANNGKAIFARCAACHTVVKGRTERARAGSVRRGRPQSSLTDELLLFGRAQELGDHMDQRQAQGLGRGTQKLAPGTKMAFGGISNPNQIADLVAYLDTLK